MAQKINRGQRGFTLIELLVVIALLGIVAVIVVLNLGSLFGMGVLQAANTEMHQVQTAVTAYMAENTDSIEAATIGPTSNYPMGEPANSGVHKYLVNPGMLQAVYTITDGSVTEAATVDGSKWGISPPAENPTIWFCNGMWQDTGC